jgi:hypothetical protein
MLWLDTTLHILKQRNEANDAWLSIWDLVNNKPIASNLVSADFGAALKDPAAATAGLRTLGSGAAQACAGNDSRLSDARPPTDASVSQSKLKASQGSVSVVVDAQEKATTASPPGGEYGFACEVKCSERVLVFDGFSVTSLSTSYALPGGRFTNNNENCHTGYVQQRYISASGRDHWIFLLLNKTTRAILSAYEAPDHPSANSQVLHTDMPHPFGSYDPAQHDIVLVDNDVLRGISPLLNRRTGILDIIHQHCIIDDARSADYQARELRKINEWPDDPYPGCLKTEKHKVERWAKVLIQPEWIALETFAIEKLPVNIQYRKLYLTR